MKQNPQNTDFIAQGGAMGKLIAANDWSAHPLGPIEQWPQSLRSALSICLYSKFPMCVYWGEDMYLLYNDAWSVIPGDKHPASLGKPAREVWSDIWHLIEPAMRRVFKSGEGLLFEQELLPMNRRGFVEEAYFDYTFSPVVGENGTVVGIFNVGNDVTQQVLDRRQNDTLQKLTEKSVVAESPEAAAILAANTLSEAPEDIPFVLIYLLSNDGTQLRLAACESIESDTALSAVKINLNEKQKLPLKTALTSKQPQIVTNLNKLYSVPNTIWGEQPHCAVVDPIINPQTKEQYGVMIYAISPRLLYNRQYVRYHSQITRTVAIAISNAYELRKKLNLESREHAATKRLQAALSTGSIGVWVWDIKANKVMGDQNLAVQFGVDRQQAEDGLPLSVFTDSIHPDDREWVLKRIQTAVTTTKVFEAEYRTVTGDGTIRWVLARGKIEDDDNGMPSRFPGVMVDVTDRKEIESELASSERMFSALFESSILGVAVATLDGKVHQANNTFLRMFKYTAKDLEKGLYSHMMTPSTSHAITKSIYKSLRDKGEVETTEKEYVRKDGVIIPVMLGAVMIPGSADRFICFMLDISEQKQLRALNKAKDEFISIASHQLRTPATGVKQYLGMLIEGYAGELNEAQIRMIETAYQSNERQLVIVNDLLRVAQADADEVILQLEKTNIIALLESIITEQSIQIKESGKRISFVHDAKVLNAVIDPLNLRMAFENIIDNAHKYTPTGKNITVYAHRNGHKISVVIKDEGIGILKKDMPKLFKKFSRIDNPLSSSAGGTGLGLYWVRKIIDLHGGTIEVASQHKQGTEFTITLKDNLRRKASVNVVNDI